MAELEFAAGNIDAAITETHAMIGSGLANPRQLTLGLGNLTAYLLKVDRTTEAKLTAFRGLHEARALGWQAAIVRVVEHLALIAALGGDATGAARLLGFTETFYAAETASREITEFATYDRLVQELKDKLQHERLAELMAEGARLTSLQAAELAMKT
jgi:hypothetical protein